MLIKISNDLQNQEIKANKTEALRILGENINEDSLHIHTFKRPITISDNYRISKLNPLLRDILFSLYESPTRVVEYDGVRIERGAAPIDIWFISIDTILFAKALNRILCKINIKNAIEIGCGGGFLSKYILAKSWTIKSLIVNEINPQAIRIAKKNIHDSRAHFWLGDGVEKLKNNKFDLIVCNPPYLPKPETKKINSYGGIELMNFLVIEGHRYLTEGGAMILNIPNLCRAVLPIEKLERAIVLEKMNVPLKITAVLNNKKWINYL